MFWKNKKPAVFESSIFLHLDFRVVSIAKNTTKCLKPHAVAESPHFVADYVEFLLLMSTHMYIHNTCETISSSSI